ncbi:restriction endonuclease subunit S [Sinomonas atrocyanea]|nr:restriction endonuclease subunit S [Sinomonas atrocyanea]
MVTEITDGAHISPETSGGVFDFVSTRDLSPGGIDFEGSLKTSPETYEYMVRAGCQPLDGDVLFSKDGTVGRTVVVRGNHPFVVASSLIIIRPNQDKLTSRFLDYLCQSHGVQEQVRSFVKGAGLPRLSIASLRRIDGVFPPLPEQQRIADFLDRETGEIDAFIADQEELVAVLQERREAVVTHAVTEGLNAGAPTKNSGVAWFGDIPLQWQLRKLKSIVSTPITDGPHETPEAQSSGVPFVSAEAVSSGAVDFEKIWGFISREDHARFSRKYKPQRGDIYMVKSGATTGICAIVETDLEFNIWSPLAAIRCGASALPRFVLHSLRSHNFQDSVALHWNYGTQQNIGMKVIGNLSIPLPPLEEQAEIAAYLDRETAEIDAVIADAKEAIEVSKERRAALISAAVTGKIDVCNHVATMGV